MDRDAKDNISIGVLGGIGVEAFQMSNAKLSGENLFKISENFIKTNNHIPALVIGSALAGLGFIMDNSVSKNTEISKVEQLNQGRAKNQNQQAVRY